MTEQSLASSQCVLDRMAFQVGKQYPNKVQEPSWLHCFLGQGNIFKWRQNIYLNPGPVTILN